MVNYFSSINEVECVYLFGSYVRKDVTPLSDVDIAVYLSSRVSRDKYFDLRLRLYGEAMRLLRTEEVDVVLLNQAGIQFAYEIILTGKILYERDQMNRITFETRTIDRYLDFKPVLLIQQEYFLQQIRRGEVFG